MLIMTMINMENDDIVLPISKGYDASGRARLGVKPPEKAGRFKGAV
jgi:hypothetical protein